MGIGMAKETLWRNGPGCWEGGIWQFMGGCGYVLECQQIHVLERELFLKLILCSKHVGIPANSFLKRGFFLS